MAARSSIRDFRFALDCVTSVIVLETSFSIGSSINISSICISINKFLVLVELAE